MEQEKLITFAVPCYNSAAYMEHCVETLLQGGDDIEIMSPEKDIAAAHSSFLAAPGLKEFIKVHDRQRTGTEFFQSLPQRSTESYLP